jgi:hypothetical protein
MVERVVSEFEFQETREHPTAINEKDLARLSFDMVLTETLGQRMKVAARGECVQGVQ